MTKNKFTVICDNCNKKTSILLNSKNDIVVFEDKYINDFNITSIGDRIEIECKTCHNKVFLDKNIKKAI